MLFRLWSKVAIPIVVLLSLVVSGVPVEASKPIPTVEVVMTVSDSGHASVTLTWENVKLIAVNAKIHDLTEGTYTEVQGDQLKGRKIHTFEWDLNRNQGSHNLQAEVLLWTSKGEYYGEAASPVNGVCWAP